MGRGSILLVILFFSADTEIRTIDWGSDANYYSDTSNDHLVNNYDTLTEEIKDAVKIIGSNDSARLYVGYLHAYQGSKHYNNGQPNLIF